MVQELVCDMLRHMSITDFEQYKKAVAKVEKERYDEMWWTHEKNDDYIYRVHYIDKHTHLLIKGKDAYKEYMSNRDAIMVERYTKDLFPTYTTLMRKETA